MKLHIYALIIFEDFDQFKKFYANINIVNNSYIYIQINTINFKN